MRAENVAARWHRASEIAVAAMGAKAADADPLAYWCLVELIYSYGNRRGPVRTK